jgi:poly-gamma-glutamate synthesis protein (capsule biosynthesis protein)
METVKLFLTGDVMTGRGIDQILPRPVDPTLHEPWIEDARRYVALAERANGPIPRLAAPAAFSYVWGDVLAELERVRPAARIVNLETAVTTNDAHWPGKGIHYRMHPGNAPVLTAAGIDCCVLANNHVLDWGYAGLEETLNTLRGAGLRCAGAGQDLAEARNPAVLETGGGRRVLVVAMALVTSGVPEEWAASAERAGVSLLPEPPEAVVPRVCELLERARRPGDLAVASIHWGGNWGYQVPTDQRRLAHRLIEEAGVAVVHGHSSHHAKAIEVHQGRLILYGCGDFLTDYEGIGGYEEYRGDLALAYFPSLDPQTGELRFLEITPFTHRRFHLERASTEDARWLATLLTREGEPFHTSAELIEEGRLHLRWRIEIFPSAILNAMTEPLLKVEPGAPNVIGEAAGGRLELLPLSVEQYDRMIEEGILPEDTGVELLDGVLVRKDRGDAGGDPMTVGESHAYVVRQLAHLGHRLDPARMHLQTQQPIIIPGAGEPEPDAAIVRRPLTAPGKPRADQISCVIEVAGTSLERDRTTKLRHYARAGIPQYVILNLADRTAEEYLKPDQTAGKYAKANTYSDEALLGLLTGHDQKLEAPVAELFPAG